MRWYHRFLIGVVLVGAGIALFASLIRGNTVALFEPQGAIAGQESHVIALMVLLMLFVVIPMFTVLFVFAWKYREGNSRAQYEPTRAKNGLRQFALWCIPGALIAVLAVINWTSIHIVDPYTPNQLTALSSSTPALTVQVVALPWKWLFIYPQQNIATVNFLEFPVNTPVHFELTADAPMSSFWIPQLGSQIYAMDAMETQLNLIASTTGQFQGKDTEINGTGYAGMTFTANSVSVEDFNAWEAGVAGSNNPLNENIYATLAAPSEYNPPALYSSVDPGLFNNIMMKYMMPPGATTSRQAMPGMDMMPGMQM